MHDSKHIPPLKASYNVSETASLLGLSRWTIYRLINAGYLHARAIRNGHRGLRIPHESIHDYIQSQTHDPHA